MHPPATNPSDHGRFARETSSAAVLEPAQARVEAARRPFQPLDDQDLDLVRRVQAGETAAFESLVARHERRIYRTVAGVLGSSDDVEDCVQDAFLKAYSYLGEFRGASKFSTWLTRIAINEGLQRIRRRRPVESLDDEAAVGGQSLAALVESEDEWDDPEIRCSREQQRALVQRAIDRLPAAYRVVVTLRDIEGLSTGETAAALDLTCQAVKTRLHRARLKLRGELAPHFEQPGRGAAA